MNLTVNQCDDLIVITVDESRLDAAVSTRFKDRMREIITRTRCPVVIDMRRVDFMDSSGLGAMIAVHKAMPGGLALTLDGLTPNVARVFRLTRMDSVFAITDSTPQQEKRA
ncbi:MAG: STAS domain-containing protein [Paracoccus sp. (in: a-proteobacteria)]|nr:STAS domain-containing protein [Paracoccus sp. (in: a-proteobacteria)]